MPHGKEYQPDTDFRTPAQQGREMPRTQFNVFGASLDLLSETEAHLLRVLQALMPDDGFLPPETFRPTTLAALCGQKHTGNMGRVFESLCRKDFITYWKSKNMFRVKSAEMMRGRQ